MKRPGTGHGLWGREGKGIGGGIQWYGVHNVPSDRYVVVVGKVLTCMLRSGHCYYLKVSQTQACRPVMSRGWLFHVN